MRRRIVAVILQGAGLFLANVGVFLWSVPVGFVTLGLSGVLIGVTLERIDAG
ncbi:hypothetical protein UFOVP957_34 [uncultured Caudovirales phage]|uniref:Uncharacterized protein n=1 Tax=uncultured Caudovirales phage TaxID=2100421 RepID=A0A6J5LSS9_9CAUD|nr:hypothetical protein UFOVP283_14 [uncultured Caudovirales phage]CAB4174301.1 hypothetical protein UFOVP957_34 [uncultured Caudovirales phage]CAB4192132.1 hypothetical protein UFOVP1231_5 [uncultured Caudovirales phage]